ncbi:MAG: pseudouridine synthase [Saprospiraceae bacterium]
MDKKLQILYQDDYLVAINKPAGHLVHPSPIARNATRFVLQELRDQIGHYVYPIHRLDRKTSGVLILALDKETNQKMGSLFANHDIVKEYRAIVRGWIVQDGTIDYELTNDRGKRQNATTNYNILQRVEIPLAHGHFDTSRYSYIQLFPKTGRQHQLRKHMGHLRHPILGDRPHGCNKQNRLWKNNYDFVEMMLHAIKLSFVHPITNVKIEIEAPFSDEFVRICNIMGVDVSV